MAAHNGFNAFSSQTLTMIFFGGQSIPKRTLNSLLFIPVSAKQFADTERKENLRSISFGWVVGSRIFFSSSTDLNFSSKRKGKFFSAVPWFSGVSEIGRKKTESEMYPLTLADVERKFH